MKTDFRRWWVINSLHHASERKNDVAKWIPEMHLYAWMTGSDIEGKVNERFNLDKSIFKAPIAKFFHIVIMRKFFKDDDWTDVSKVLAECIEMEWVEVYRGKIRLRPAGESNYALSSFIVYMFDKYKPLAVGLYTAFIFALWPIFKYLWRVIIS